MKKNILIALLGILSISQALAQDVIWKEDFNDFTNGTNNLNQTNAKWHTKAGDCDDSGIQNNGDNYWGVYNGEFRANDIEGQTCGCANNGENDNYFYTESINVSNYTAFTISMKGRAVGDMECTNDCAQGGDLLEASYQLDGGAWIEFFSMCGAQNGTSSAGCIQAGNASTLKIRIKVGTQANAETYYFDDIQVMAAPTMIDGIDVIKLSEGFQFTTNSAQGSWSSEFPAIASVNAHGYVQANSVGFTTITFTTPSGCSISKQVEVSSCSTPSIQASDVSRCGTGSVTLHATATTGASILWYDQLSAHASIANGPDYVTPTLTSTTHYFVAASNGNCTSSRIDVSAIINPQASLSLVSPVASTQQNTCLGASIQSIQYKINGTTTATISGLPNGTSNSISNDTLSITGTPTQSGNFNYKISLSGTCVAPEMNGSINISPAGVIKITNPSNTCQGTSFDFMADAGYDMYHWKINGTAVTNETDAIYTHTSNTAEELNIEVFGSYTNGCKSLSANSNISLNQKPAAPIIDDYRTCTSNNALKFSELHNSSSNIQWFASIDATTPLSNTSLNISKATDTVFYASINSVGGCNSDRGSVRIIANESPRITAISQTDNGTVSLDIIGGLAPYSYDFESTLGTVTNSNLVLEELLPGTYSLLISDNNQCKVETNITIGNYLLLKPAQFFSPNGDGINDRWEIENIEDYPKTEVFVYNRFGKEVFHTENNFSSWDGTYLGKDLASENYWYVILIRETGDKLNGHFALKR